MKALSTMDLVTPLITVAVADMSLLIGWYLLKNRLLDQIDQFMSNYIKNTLDNITKNPEILKPLVDSLTKMGMESLGIDKVKSPSALKIGGLKIPGWLVEAAMPFVQGQIAKQLPAAAGAAAANPLG
jgi:hypothetical protein